MARLLAGQPRNNIWIPSRGKRRLSSSKRQDQFWNTSTLLLKKYRKLISQEHVMTTHLPLKSRITIPELTN